MNKNCLIIPAYRPTSALPELITHLKNTFDVILIVDDGNSKDYKKVFSACISPQTIILKHTMNQGKGAALKTAFAYVINSLPQINTVITCDADGQHLSSDIMALMKAALAQSDDVILGVRKLSDETPFKSRIGNRLTRFIFRLLYGVYLEDTQTGLRAIPRKMLSPLVLLPANRYDFEMAMLIYLVTEKKKIYSFPITSVYLNENKSSSFRPIIDSLRIYALILQKLWSYTIVGLMSFALDWVIFLVLITTIFQSHLAFLAVLVARIVSGLFNYTLNFYVVFQSREKHKHSLLRYLMIYTFNILVSTSAMYLTSIYLPNLIIPAKVIIDLCLFTVSFISQKRWVF